MYQEIGFLDDLLLHIYNELCGFGDMVWFVCWLDSIAAVRYLLFVVVVLLLAVRLFYKRSEQQQSSCPIILCNNVEPHLLKELLFSPSIYAVPYFYV